MRAAVLILGLVMVGCSGRDPVNPFDPDNPETGGVPSAAWARASCARVGLEWNDLDMVDIAGFEIRRWEASAGEEQATLLTPEMLDPSLRSHADPTALNGTTYDYAVDFVFADGTRLPTRAVRSEPGAALPWVGDPCGWGLTLLTPDGRAVVRRTAEGGAILDLAVDNGIGRLFAARIDSNQVLVVRTSDGEPLASLTVSGASAVSWNRDLGLLAVGAFYERKVTWMTASGEVAHSLTLDGYPEDLVLRDSSTTWVAMEDGRLLRQAIGESAIEPMPVVLDRAVHIADDPDQGGCWVADRAGGRVAYVTDEGEVSLSASGVLIEPMALAADGGGRCWVADRTGGKLVLLDRQCREIDRLAGRGPVVGVAVDAEHGDLWLTYPEEGALERIAADGNETRLVIGGCPRFLVGEWSGGCDGVSGVGGGPTREEERRPGRAADPERSASR